MVVGDGFIRFVQKKLTKKSVSKWSVQEVTFARAWWVLRFLKSATSNVWRIEKRGRYGLKTTLLITNHKTKRQKI